MKFKVIIAIAVLALIGIGAGLYFGLSSDDGAPSEKVADTRGPKHTERTQFNGQSPADMRLRDGAQQVHDPVEALAMARESLSKVEKEIAAASSDDERQRLIEKKALIEQAIDRLVNGE